MTSRAEKDARAAHTATVLDRIDARLIKLQEQQDARVGVVDRLLAARIVERVVVTLDSGSAFVGVLTAVDDRSLLLREAEQVGNGERVGVDGELLIPRHRVEYVQKP